MHLKVSEALKKIMSCICPLTKILTLAYQTRNRATAILTIMRHKKHLWNRPASNCNLAKSAMNSTCHPTSLQKRCLRVRKTWLSLRIPARQIAIRPLMATHVNHVANKGLENLHDRLAKSPVAALQQNTTWTRSRWKKHNEKMWSGNLKKIENQK